MLTTTTTPFDLGAPTKFKQWREGQLRAVVKAFNSDKRFVALSLPTGSGKTLIYMCLANMFARQTGLRVCVLTSTKALQDQLARDFGNDLVDVRGMNNYPCVPLQSGGEFYDPSEDEWQRNCDRGPCKTGTMCKLRHSGCHYFDKVRAASSARVVSTNYAYWMAGAKSLGPIDLLVLDEAHKAPAELAGFLSTSLSHLELRGMLGSHSGAESAAGWADWASGKLIEVRERMISGLSSYHDRTHAREQRALERIERKLKIIAMCDDDWIIERTDKGMRFDPIWPRKLNHYLFKNAKKVIMTSATVRPKTCELLGIDPDELYFYESDSVFPLERRPFIHIPTVRLNHRSSPEALRHWAVTIDQIINKRPGLSGVIHTVSYQRMHYLLAQSQHSERMMTHDTRTTARVVEQFKSSTAGSILVSPSATTGYDFPYSQCRWQIISKVPFPDTRSKILKARCKDDKEFGMYLAMQELVQASGRGMRASDDWCEVFCVDDNVGWFLNKYKHFAPKWFIESYSKKTLIPKLCNFDNGDGS